MRKINSKLTFFACSLMVLFWFLIVAAIFAPAFIEHKVGFGFYRNVVFYGSIICEFLTVIGFALYSSWEKH